MYRRHSQPGLPGIEQSSSGQLSALAHSLSLTRSTSYEERRSSATEAQRWGHRTSPNKRHRRDRTSSSSTAAAGQPNGLKVTRFFPRNFDAKEGTELEEEVAAFAALVTRNVGLCGASSRPTLENNGVLLPTSPFLKSWTVVLFVLIGWTALVTPFQVWGVLGVTTKVTHLNADAAFRALCLSHTPPGVLPGRGHPELPQRMVRPGA